MTPLPLAGLRVVAVEQYGAGPFGSMHLADLGAEIIKIEPPRGGDASRGTGPHFLGPDDSQFFQTFNRNKRSLALDIAKPEGRAVLLRLLATADAEFDNLRGDLPERLGLTYDALKHINPKLACVHLSAYGRDGTRSNWPGYDYLMQAEAGFLWLTGEPGTPPARMGLSVVDYMTGLTAALGLAAAVIGARATGQGRDVDVSLYDVAMHQLSYPATWFLNEGTRTERRPRSGHPFTVPCELFPTADGWVFVMCMKPKFWQILCDVLGAPQLPEDTRFASAAARHENRDELAATLDPLFQTQPTEHWLGRLTGKIPVAPVHDLAAALQAPFLAERGLVQQVPHPSGTAVRMLAGPYRLDNAPPLPMQAAPALGADNAALLGELGYGADEIAALRASNIVGPATS